MSLIHEAGGQGVPSRQGKDVDTKDYQDPRRIWVPTRRWMESKRESEEVAATTILDRDEFEREEQWRRRLRRLRYSIERPGARLKSSKSPIAKPVRPKALISETQAGTRFLT